jgi:subtilisin family serine protease
LPEASTPPAPGPSAAPSASTATGPSAAPPEQPPAHAAVDPTGRWIVVLRPGTDTVAATADHGRKLGFRPDRLYRHAIHGYAARLSRDQVAALRRDPSVAEVVPDEVIHVESQAMPTGITRVGANRSAAANINGSDDRVDADVAIVDTGITHVADLNVVGGYNCSTSNRGAWRDVYGHGTHVAGTVGAIDNASGVVGVAPGVRLWAVKILNDSGEGLLSWYVCGLDWIAGQRDAADPSRPKFEAVNMSVAKWGSDDRNCGATNHDVLHAAICRLVASGVTVVAAAGNDSSSAAARVPAAYNEVITVSALADTDGRPGGLGGHRCFSWGTYDNDDSFADFSNRGSDVDLIAPGKCIWSTVPGGYAYMSGTSMATPHVTGAVALLKATRPGLTPAEVREALRYLGNMNWKWWTDPDPYHEKLLDVSRIGSRGDFSVAAGPDVPIGPGGGVVRFPITITRSATSFERIRLAASDLPAGFAVTFDPSSVYGFAGVASTASVVVPSGLRDGSYPITITGDEHGRTHLAAATVVVESGVPIAQPPATATRTKAKLGATTVPTRTSWAAATDPGTGIAGYELQSSLDGGAWVTSAATSADIRSAEAVQGVGHSYRYRVRARDTTGTWSAWAGGPAVTGVLVQDRSTAVSFSGGWHRAWYSYASGGTTTWTTTAGAKARTTFSGQGIAIVGQTGPDKGSVSVYLDGRYWTAISFASATNRGRLVLFSTKWSALGTHTIELRARGTGRVDLDAFVILR